MNFSERCAPEPLQLSHEPLQILALEFKLPREALRFAPEALQVHHDDVQVPHEGPHVIQHFLGLPQRSAVRLA